MTLAQLRRSVDLALSGLPFAIGSHLERAADGALAVEYHGVARVWREGAGLSVLSLVAPDGYAEQEWLDLAKTVPCRLVCGSVQEAVGVVLDLVSTTLSDEEIATLAGNLDAREASGRG